MTGKPLDRRPQTVLNLPPKKCAVCDQPFSPRAGEYRSEFEARKCCTKTCRARNAHKHTRSHPHRPRYTEDALAWRLSGLCRGFDPDLFDPSPGPESDDTRTAKAICAECPVRFECLTWALEKREWGVWGGTTRADREEMAGRSRQGGDRGPAKPGSARVAQ